MLELQLPALIDYGDNNSLSLPQSARHLPRVRNKDGDNWFCSIREYSDQDDGSESILTIVHCCREPFFVST